MRRLALGLVIAALGVVGYLVLGWTRRSAGDPEYVTAPADRGPITPSVAATGTVNPVTTVQVGTYVSGPIQAIYADFNTPVRRGQLLARIDPRPFQVKVDYTEITSPVDGVVVARNVAVGQTVAATFQTPTLFLVAGDLAKMAVDASVSESDIGGIAPGQDVSFTVDAYPADTFRGRV